MVRTRGKTSRILQCVRSARKGATVARSARDCHIQRHLNASGARMSQRSALAFIGLVMLMSLVTPCVTIVSAQRPTLGNSSRQFVSVDAPVVALTHVRLVDGTGTPAKDDQTV